MPAPLQAGLLVRSNSRSFDAAGAGGNSDAVVGLPMLKRPHDDVAAEQEFRLTEFLPFLLVVAALNLLLPPLLLPARPPVWANLLLEGMIVGLAFELGALSRAVFVPSPGLHRLTQLATSPRVAVLYLVCDDLVPLALARLGTQTYALIDIFILDDSRDPPTRQQLDATPYTVIRRRDRIGYKAGSINNWLRRHGAAYDYFLVLDSDSIVPPSFVNDLLSYAEHPDNADVAIFNSLAGCWNTHLPFPRALSALEPAQNWVHRRTAPVVGSIFSTGHNNLHRVRAILSCGGFPEEYLAEDIAMTLALAKRGHRSALVNVVGYEAEPEQIFSYTRRLERWAKQTVQILRADWDGMPSTLSFQMFKQVYRYSSHFIVPAYAAILALHVYISSLPEYRGIDPTVMRHDSAAMLIQIAFAAIFPVIVLMTRIPFLIAFKIRPMIYLRYVLLNVAIAYHVALSVCQAQVVACFSRSLPFDVTQKHVVIVNFWHIACHKPGGYVLALTVLISLSHNQPMLLVVSPWLLLFIASPVILSLFHTSSPAGSRMAMDRTLPSLADEVVP